ncbi:MAG: hypothetical protein ACREOU_08090 [Candidatus Eiseniibacteriota bacterium]
MSVPPAKRSIGLLGPQRLTPTLSAAVTALGIEGSLAVVTAGWQEREDDTRELVEHLAGRAVNLELHRRAERVFERDPELARAHHERQELFRRMHELYRFRLEAAKRVARALFARAENGPALASERGDSIEAIRRLDERHLGQQRAIHAEFEARWRPFEREAVRTEREEIRGVLEKSAGLGIAGGHVAVLVNRLRLFGIVELLGTKPVVAWSAGAMVCAESIVLFHDFPPQGTGSTEVLDVGLGLAPGIQPFPHAKRRLDLSDPVRIQMLALRFAPASCVALEDGAHLLRRGRDARWHGDAGCTRFAQDGAIVPLSTVEGALA